MARLRELPPGCRVVTRSGFNGTVVGTARLVDVNVVLVNLDLLAGMERNPVVVFPENLTPVHTELAAPAQAHPTPVQHRTPDPEMVTRVSLS